MKTHAPKVNTTLPSPAEVAKEFAMSHLASLHPTINTTAEHFLSQLLPQLVRDNIISGSIN